MHSRWRTAGVLLALYVGGLGHWIYFFNAGRMSFEYLDWPKEYGLYQVLRAAIQECRLPYHVSEPFHDTDRFLGLPETVLSPQILLLPLLGEGKEGVGRFLVVHTCLMYSLGFLGCLALRRRYRLGLVACTCLVGLVLFNGYITAHLAAGHTMWNGFFLLPFFVLYVLEILEDAAAAGPPLKLALVLFAMMLQGSFHMVIWCWLFLAALGVGHPAVWRRILIVGGVSGLLCCFRLIPAAFVFWQFEPYPFVTGYRTLTDVLDAFTVMRPPPSFVETASLRIGWWEYDIYIGVPALVMVLYFGLWPRRDGGPLLTARPYRALAVPMAVLAVCSFADTFALVARLPLPLASGERVPSRFLILPVIFLMVLACIRLQRTWDKAGWGKWTTCLWWLGIGQTLVAMTMHTAMWRIAQVDAGGEDIFPFFDYPRAAEIISRPDSGYFASLAGGAAVSLFGLALWLVLFFRTQRAAPR